MRRLLIKVASICLLSTPASADADLRAQLQKPIVATLMSSKSVGQLQLCAADAIGEGLLPLPFPPDESSTVHIFGFGGMMGAGTVQRVVSLVPYRGRTRMEVRTRSSRPDDTLVNLLRACL